MGLFRRTPGRRGTDDRFRAFWDWWQAEGRAAAERSIAGDLPPQELAELVTPRVHQVAPLAWELAAGELTQHVLVLSAEGDADLRPDARRLVLAAPEPDDAWSYVDARPPAADPEGIVLGTDGELVDFDRVRVSARLQGPRFDVTVHHPAFTELSADARLRVTFLALDAALGELATELWIGEIEASEVPPLDGFGLAALRSVVRDLERQHLDADGRPRWTLLQGSTPDGPLVALVRQLLVPASAPHLDTYVSISLPYAGRTDEGLPDEASLAALGDFEQQLGGLLGTSGEVVAHLSTGGVRTLHAYVDSTAGLGDDVAALARTWGQGRAAVHTMVDPQWEAVAHLRR